MYRFWWDEEDELRFFDDRWSEFFQSYDPGKQHSAAIEMLIDKYLFYPDTPIPRIPYTPEYWQRMKAIAEHRPKLDLEYPPRNKVWDSEKFCWIDVEEAQRPSRHASPPMEEEEPKLMCRMVEEEEEQLSRTHRGECAFRDRLCTFFVHSHCVLGDECRFSHNPSAHRHNPMEPKPLKRARRRLRERFPEMFEKLEKGRFSHVSEPKALLCPLTQKVMWSPMVLVKTGTVYDLRSLSKWFQISDTDPMTGKLLRSKNFVFVPIVKHLIAYLLKDTKPASPRVEEEEEEEEEEAENFNRTRWAGRTSKDGICHYYMSSHCVNGDKCKFSHDRSARWRHPIETRQLQLSRAKLRERFPEIFEKAERGYHSKIDGPKILMCPLSQKIMWRPVVLVATGVAFDYRSLRRWFQISDANPITGRKLKKKKFIDVPIIKHLISCIVKDL